MQSALIIGAGGQDGRLLAHLLSRRNYTVHGWVRRMPSDVPLCECAIVNILSSTSVESELQLFQPNEIYYLAAFHHSPEDSIEEDTAVLLRRSFDIHVTGLLNVLGAMKKYSPQTRLFYAASSHIFGKSAEDWQDETTLLRPDSPYAISKAAGLRCCQLFRRRENVFAANGILFNHESHLRKPSFVSQKIVCGALRARRDPNFRLKLGDLDAQVDWGYAPDYVEAIFRVLQLPHPDDFVIASGELHSVGEFVELAFNEVGLDWRDHVTTDQLVLKRSSHPLRGDASKIRSATGWAPTIGFNQLVGTLVREVKQHL